MISNNIVTPKKAQELTGWEYRDILPIIKVLAKGDKIDRTYVVDKKIFIAWAKENGIEIHDKDFKIY